MIYIVLKIVSGEEVIGVLDVENMVETHNLEYFELTDPMWVVANRDGSMKLQSATILASEHRLIIHPESVIVAYTPSESLIEYYKTAAEYSQKHTQVDIDKQIRLATEELAQAAKDSEEFESNLTQFILKSSKASIH